ncbi:MAG: radical SAM family heme chaperone HemW [Gemmatimonadaceae bacterium]|nr:radical SAM family heme chaperone HemW [Gemmatimonadaceae bacterium]
MIDAEASTARATVPRHVYVHVPFCGRRCSYCDFAIAVRREVPVAEFVRGITAELGTRLGAPAAAPVDTLYFGGGTPSKLGPDGVRRLLDAVRAFVEPVAQAEVTLEANPEDVTPDAVRAWRAAGITRVSLGVQTFEPAVLAWMHRTHSAEQSERAVALLREGGIDELSIDLIFAVPPELSRDWARDVARGLALEPTHVSVYGLTVEPQTPLARWTARGATGAASEDAYEQEFLATHAACVAAGFEHYEVSNYARPGRRARHNSAYWSGVPYLGIGPSAHGFDGAVRRSNRSAYAAWLAALPADPVDALDPLDAASRRMEAVYLGLRTTDGLLLESEAEVAATRSWVDAGWATVEGRRVRLTPTGWLRMDALATALTTLRGV